MKLIRFLFYTVFFLFISLFVFGYFAETLFQPADKTIIKEIKEKTGGDIKFEHFLYGRDSIGYVSAGNDTAQRLILVHGSPGGWGNYHTVLEHPEFYKNFHLISVDRYGYGTSSGHGDPSLSFHAAYIKELCKPSAGGKKPILVGHSMGGPIVIRSAIDYGELLTGVISVAGSFDASLEFNEWFRGLYKIFPVNLFFDRSLKSSNNELFSHKSELKKMEQDWGRISCKVTIIQGGKDNLVAPGNIDFARKKLEGKDASFILIPDQDHFIPFFFPEPMFRAINNMAGL